MTADVVPEAQDSSHRSPGKLLEIKGPGLNNGGLQNVARIQPESGAGRKAPPSPGVSGPCSRPGRWTGEDQARLSDGGWVTMQAGSQLPEPGPGLRGVAREEAGKEGPSLRTGAQAQAHTSSPPCCQHWDIGLRQKGLPHS